MPTPPTAARPTTGEARAHRRRLPLTALGFVALLFAFGAGVLHLFHLRFDVGDVYPPYSTLRGDPLGAKVLYESLRELSGLGVERSLRPLHSLGVPVMSPPTADHGEAGFACFCLGADPAQWPYLFTPAEQRRLDDVAARGGRVVLTFQPITYVPTRVALTHAREVYDETHDPGGEDPKKPRHPGDTEKKGRDRTDKKQDQPRPSPSRRAHEPRQADLIAAWQIDFRRTGPEKPGDNDASASRSGLGTARADEARPVRLAGPPAPGQAAAEEPGPAVPWHTALDFRVDTPEARGAGWRTLYERAGRPVVVARRIGGQGGEIVLVSDSYFLSNEGLHEAPQPELLAALVGPGRRVIFDESHLGIAEHPGIMTLARRYRLQGALAALALLAALFVWRNAASLLPARAGADSPGGGGDVPVTGRDAAAGFLNLLRRGVPPARLPALCAAQWQQHLSPATGPSADARHPASPENVARVQEVLAAAGRQGPAALYRAMCARLRERAPSGQPPTGGGREPRS